MDSKSQKLI